MDILKTAQDILKRQGDLLHRSAKGLDASFTEALRMLQSCKGIVYVIGFGKSGAVGAKLAATLRDAGRRVVLLSPLEALNIETASLRPGDVAVMVSSTGESDELMEIILTLKSCNVKLIVFTPMSRSSLARAADVLLKTQLPLDAADEHSAYSSCLSALALGDLLGLCLLIKQGDMPEQSRIKDGQRRSPRTIAGILTIRPINPTAPENMIIKDALLELTAKGLGAIAIVDTAGRLSGIITDGDIRRLLQRSQGNLSRLFLTNVDAVMTRNPKSVTPDKSVFDVLTLMENNAITVLPVTDADKKPVGMVHLHDLVQMGLPHNKPAAARKKQGGKLAGKKAAKK